MEQVRSKTCIRSSAADVRLQTPSGRKKHDKRFRPTLIALNVSQPATTDYALPCAHKNSRNRRIMRLFLDLLDLLIAGILILWMIMIGLLTFGATENVLFSKMRRQQQK